MQTTWMRRGTVSGRVALLLRSAEIQPPSHDLFDWFLPRNPIPLYSLLRGGYRVTWPDYFAGLLLSVRRQAHGPLLPRASRALRSLHWWSSALPAPLLACLSGEEKAGPVLLPVATGFVTAPRPCNTVGGVSACGPTLHQTPSVHGCARQSPTARLLPGWPSTRLLSSACLTFSTATGRLR